MISCYGASDRGQLGVSSNVGSELKVMNAIITNCSYALRATSGKLTASFSVWYDCGNLGFSDMSSKVTALQYIRCVNPNYERMKQTPGDIFTSAITVPVLTREASLVTLIQETLQISELWTELPRMKELA